MFTKRLVVARAINIYLEDSMHLKLTNRILQMAKKEGILDEEEYMFWTSYGIEKTENKLLKKLKLKEIEKLFENYELDKVLNEIFSFIDECNEYVQHKKPWETKDKKVLYEITDSIKAIAVLLNPFIPQTSEKIAKQFGFKIEFNEIKKPLDDKNKIVKGEVLFRKIGLEDGLKKGIKSSGLKKGLIDGL